jgi:hypothetical protein
VLNANYTITRPLTLNKTITKTLENTEGAIKHGQSKETGTIGYTPMLPVSLDCLFLIAPSIFCNVYLSCVPNVASFSEKLAT